MTERLRDSLARYPHLLAAARFAAGLAVAPYRSVAFVAAGGGVARGLGLGAVGVRRGVGVAGGVALLAGVGAGVARVAGIGAKAGRVKPGDRVEGEATVVERPRPSRFGSSAVLELPTGARVLARVPRNVRWPAGGEPGT